jgi:hypothetical protein
MPWWNPFRRKQPPLEPPVEPIPDGEKGRLLAQQMARADQAYEEMYEGRDAAGPYSDMKESMSAAISLARELGLERRVAELERTLQHRKAVFRRQLS